MQVPSGSCGYSFPNNTVPTSGAYQGSIDANNSLIAGLPIAGCGSCVMITCNRVGNQVQLPPPLGSPSERSAHAPVIPPTKRERCGDHHERAGCLPAKCRPSLAGDHRLLPHMRPEPPPGGLQPDSRQLPGQRERAGPTGTSSAISAMCQDHESYCDRNVRSTTCRHKCRCLALLWGTWWPASRPSDRPATAAPTSSSPSPMPLDRGVSSLWS